MSSDVPGTGGTIKQRPEDFLVDEIPAYQPSGAGEHLALLVQKRGLSTMEMLGIIAQHFGVDRRDVGYAGLKDKHAITRQVVTVHAPGKKLEDFPMLQHPQVGILWTDYHANKLRPGHLRGNRFSIRIRNVNPMDVRHALRTLTLLQARGVPNRVGEQRFGMIENNHRIGRAILTRDFAGALRELLGPSLAHPEFNAKARELFTQGQFGEAITAYPRGAKAETRALSALSRGRDARAALFSIDQGTLRFYLTAFQSAVFNDVLDQRLQAGTLDTILPGDVAIKHDNHAAFLVDEPTAAQDDTRERCKALAISPSGPMWSAGMMRASGPTDEAELAALARAGVSLAELEAFDQRDRMALEGKRRPLRVPLIDPEVEGGLDEHGPYIRCAFELPRGAFATNAIREVIKPGPGVGIGGSDEE